MGSYLRSRTPKVAGGSSAPAAAASPAAPAPAWGAGASNTAPDDVPPCGLKIIKEFEGCKLEAYPDPLSGGPPITIGWGSTRDKNGNPKRLKEKDWANVPDALFMYRNPGSHVEAGLARRRKAEGELWKS